MPSPPEMRSPAEPESSWSSPAPPSIVSRPKPPTTLSLPYWPWIESSPEPPSIVSSPPPPKMRSWPVSPSRTSLAIPPKIVSPPPEPLICWGSAPFARRRSGPGRAGADGAQRGRGRHEQGEGDEDEQAEAGHPSLDRHPSRGLEPRSTDARSGSADAHPDLARVAQLVRVAGLPAHAGAEAERPRPERAPQPVARAGSGRPARERGCANVRQRPPSKACSSTSLPRAGTGRPFSRPRKRTRPPGRTRRVRLERHAGAGPDARDLAGERAGAGRQRLGR